MTTHKSDLELIQRQLKNLTIVVETMLANAIADEQKQKESTLQTQTL